MSPKKTTYYRRKLPHWHPENEWLFITFRLFGSLPINRGKCIGSGGEEFVRWDRELDAATVGPTWLKDSRVALIVVDTIIEAETRGMCQVGAFVVMSNHIHLLLRPLVPVSTVMQWIKGVSALRANHVLDRAGGRFWQRESYDHFVRTGPEHRRICDYIEQNPVKAGLVDCAEDWAWCSVFVKAGTS